MTKKKLKEDLRRVIEEYESKHGDAVDFPREYYRQHGDYKDKDFCKLFGSWDKFLASVVDMDGLKEKKAAHKLNEEVDRLKKENKKLLKGAINNESILEQYKELITPIEYVKPKDIKVKDDKKISILVLSDVHLGEVVKKEEILGLNEVNSKILLERVKVVFDKFRKYSKTIGLSKCKIFLLGDLISGSIHQELSESNDLNPVEATLKLNDFLTSEILETSSQFKETDVIVISGNHARMDPKPRNKQKQILNHEYILGKMLEHNLSNQKNLNVIVPKSAYYMDEESGSLIMHGDQMGAGGGGFGSLPFYGLSRSASKFFGALESADIYERNFRNLIIGHFHCSSMLPLFQGGEIIINGSIVGTSEFSLNVMKTNSVVEQLMLVVKIKDKSIESILRLIPEK